MFQLKEQHNDNQLLYPCKLLSKHIIAINNVVLYVLFFHHQKVMQLKVRLLPSSTLC